MMTENERIIKMIVELREQNGLTKTEMAEKIGMAKQNYGRIEDCKHALSVPRLIDILDVFGLEISFIQKISH